jgi:hypothetical protein
VALVVAVVSVLAGSTATAMAAGNAPVHELGFSRFGDAKKVKDGVRLRSDATVAPGYGGVDFRLEDPVAFGGITRLQAAFDPTDDACGAGSPRFQLNIDTDGDGNSDANVFVYAGTLPSFT